MNTQQKHEESGCTDYLQHNADSCPHMTASVAPEATQFYREDKTGDFLCIEPSTNKYYREVLNEDSFEARATAITHCTASVCTTSVSRRFLDTECTKVKESQVPAGWLHAFGLSNTRTIHSTATN